jgi:Ca2+-binding RTX toxin-like protein
VNGGKGSDQIYGGAGRDTMRGGPGRDRIFAVDRTRDVILCGGGRDTVRADRVDRILGCESVRRR